MKNPYKRLDIFRCTHESHQEFGNVISVYHVIKEKACYPHGCIYFKWRCRRLEKGLGCPKSYEHVGKKCTSCADYFDEKLIKRPRLLLSQEDYQLFLKDLQGFEMWVDGQKGRELNCSGRLKAVKPRFIVNCHHGRSQVSFQGFLLIFQELFIGLTLFEDTAYALLSPAQQSRLRLGDGDRMDFRAILRLNRGRLILDRIHGVEIEEKAGTESWTVTEARQALLYGRIHDRQHEKCLNCLYGCLVDVNEAETLPLPDHKRRKLFCLKGIPDPAYCIVQAREELHQVDYCQVCDSR